MPNSVIFNTVRECELRAFWPTKQPIRILAVEWGCSAAYISVMAKNMGLPSRQARGIEICKAAFGEKFQGRVENFRYFEEAARQRGLTVDQLRIRILATVINDRMVDAVLDDQER